MGAARRYAHRVSGAAERLRIATPDPLSPAKMGKALAEMVAHFKWKGPIGVGFPGVIYGTKILTSANLHPGFIGCDGGKLFFEQALTCTIGNQAVVTDEPHLVIVHGDQHRFIVDKPLMQNGKLIYNATRLMVYGETEVQGVLVTVDPDDADVFSFRSLTVPENLPAAGR